MCACPVRERHAYLPTAGIAKFFLLNVQVTHPRFLAQDSVPKGSSSPGQEWSWVTWGCFSQLTAAVSPPQAAQVFPSPTHNSRLEARLWLLHSELQSLFLGESEAGAALHVEGSRWAPVVESGNQVFEETARQEDFRTLEWSAFIRG